MKNNNIRLISRTLSIVLATCLLIVGYPINVNADDNISDPVIMASLGDSYSSGEGIEPFYGQEQSLNDKVKNENWLAHRSQKSWPSLLQIPGLSGTMSNLTVDSQFLNNAIGASSNGIEIGAYRYGYATTVEEARKEALMTIQAIKTAESNGAKFTYPIAYDVEDEATQGKLSKSELTAIIKEFQSVIESYGYKFMIYANRNWLTTKIDMEEFSDVDVWVASWFNDNTPNHDHGYRGPGNVTIWQYTSQGSVPGISGYVDMNVGYGDY